jgi:hypothetical protein
MKGVAELAQMRRREGNARWLHVWKGELKSLNFRREEPRGAEARTKKVQCLCYIERATAMKRLSFAAIGWPNETIGPFGSIC